MQYTFLFFFFFFLLHLLPDINLSLLVFHLLTTTACLKKKEHFKVKKHPIFNVSDIGQSMLD